MIICIIHFLFLNAWTNLCKYPRTLFCTNFITLSTKFFRKNFSNIGKPISVFYKNKSFISRLRNFYCLHMRYCTVSHINTPYFYFWKQRKFSVYYLINYFTRSEASTHKCWTQNKTRIYCHNFNFRMLPLEIPCSFFCHCFWFRICVNMVTDRVRPVFFCKSLVIRQIFISRKLNCSCTTGNDDSLNFMC